MKFYKSVNLNPRFHFLRKKDLKNIAEKTNKMIEDGWKLEQIVAPNDLTGVIIGFFKGCKSF